MHRNRNPFFYLPFCHPPSRSLKDGWPHWIISEGQTFHVQSMGTREKQHKSVLTYFLMCFQRIRRKHILNVFNCFSTNCMHARCKSQKCSFYICWHLGKFAQKGCMKRNSARNEDATKKNKNVRFNTPCFLLMFLRMIWYSICGGDQFDNQCGGNFPLHSPPPPP